MQLHEPLARLAVPDLVVRAVSFEPPETIRRYLDAETPPFPILSDPDRRGYALFGLAAGATSTVWGPSTWLAYLRGLVHGQRPRRPSGDLHQLGGNVVIDRSGSLVYLYQSSTPADRPSIEEVIAAVKAAAEPEFGAEEPA